MWSDNETDQDFLNFRCVADTAATIIVEANNEPLSMGISGGWGVGKSSMLKLMSESLKQQDSNQFLFVEFNAWLYQSYDDARTSLMEVIARKLVEHGYSKEKSPPWLDKAKQVLHRVNWFRIASWASLISKVNLSGQGDLPTLELFSVLPEFSNGDFGEANHEETNTEEIHSESADAWKSKIPDIRNLLKSPEKLSPSRQIQELRDLFEETLCEMDVTLVVFIDDLDRCLPATAIATLEAIRLFLFLQNTAFIIAADDRMLQQAVRIHFQGADLDDDIITHYFDKFIQVPLRVPPLGTQEVRAYLALLFVEDSNIEAKQKEKIRKRVCARLSESWKGHRVDLPFLKELIGNYPTDLLDDLELADRLAPLMTTAKHIAGNPRLIKRFLNTLRIRLALAREQQVTVEVEVLAKLLLFERCASEEAYSELISAINEDDDGKPSSLLLEWEKHAETDGNVPNLPSAWDTSFVHDWLALEPPFAEIDLRPAMYVSRELAPIIHPSNRLSSNAVEILQALMKLKRKDRTLIKKLCSISSDEVAIITRKLIVQARKIQAWKEPSALWGLLTVAAAHPKQQSDLIRFLESIPTGQLQADIVPLLGDLEWAQGILAKWANDTDTLPPVKKAIQVIKEKK